MHPRAPWKFQAWFHEEEESSEEDEGLFSHSRTPDRSGHSSSGFPGRQRKHLGLGWVFLESVLWLCWETPEIAVISLYSRHSQGAQAPLSPVCVIPSLWRPLEPWIWEKHLQLRLGWPWRAQHPGEVVFPSIMDGQRRGDVKIPQ